MISGNFVKLWLTYCDDQGIKPWEFDFKFFYKDDADTSSAIELWLKYRLNVLHKLRLNNSVNQVLKDEINKLSLSDIVDPDKLAFPIYKALNWQENPDDIVRGDSMNSFKATFTQDIMKSQNRKAAYRQIQIDINEYLDKQYDVLLKNKNYLAFEIVHNNQVEQFAKLTHTVGNFTVLPYEFNVERGMSATFHDYWDKSLDYIRTSFLEVENAGATLPAKLQPLVAEEKLDWPGFVEKYYLQPFVNQGAYTVGELWTDHLKRGAYPTRESDFTEFYYNINLLIVERGKWMTKELCDKYGLQTLSFYQNDLKNMTRIKHFDEIVAR